MEKARFFTFNKFLELGRNGSEEIQFWRGPALWPVFVLYSSGTTGKPKAIIHHHIGSLLVSKLHRAINYELVGPFFIAPYDICKRLYRAQRIVTTGSG